MPIDIKWLEEAETVLTEVIGAILHTNKSLKTKFIDAIIAKGAGGAGALGIAGLVSTLGTASTGTAIGTLTGAAANTATLYWLGGLVGGGVAAGGGVLIGVGVLTGFGVSRLWRGKPRSKDSINDHERELLGAIEVLLPAIRHDIEQRSLPNSETEKVLDALWADLCASIDIYRKEDVGELAPKHRLTIKRSLTRMRKLLRDMK